MKYNLNFHIEEININERKKSQPFVVYVLGVGCDVACNIKTTKGLYISKDSSKPSSAIKIFLFLLGYIYFI